MAISVRQQDFDQLSDHWERLLPQCSIDTIFLTPHWQRSWWQEFGGNAELCLLYVEWSGPAQGIAPLMNKDGVISFLGNTDLFDYCDFLVPRGAEAGFYSALLDHLEPMSWHTLDLHSIRCDSPTMEHLSTLARERGYGVEVSQEDVTLGTALPNSWDEYLAGLSKKDRHELRRKMRRLEGSGEARQYACTDPDSLSEHMAEFLRLLKASRPDKAEFLTPERERFFHRAALELAKRGQIRLSFLDLDGVCVASAMCFDYHDSLLLYNSGYDPAYSSLSVGLLNTVLCVKEAIEEGKRFFDFLKGSESYKYHLGGRDLALCHMVISR